MFGHTFLYGLYALLFLIITNYELMGTLTVSQYKTIIDTYKDFYADDRLDIRVYGTLKDYLNKKELTEEEENTPIGGWTTMECITYHPEVTVTNEYGKSHKITDVYVKVSFPSFEIELARTSYTSEEIRVGYIHSHVHRGNYFTAFNSFCTGAANTPINEVKKSIKNFYTDKTLVTGFATLIMSFIIEVERMIKVESIDGGPYIKMSTINAGVSEGSKPVTIPSKTGVSMLVLVNGVKQTYVDDLKKFFIYYASLRLDSFYYDGQNWQLDCSDSEFISRVTKVAKTYKGTRSKISLFKKVLYADGLYYCNSYSTTYHLFPHSHTTWTFKTHLLEVKCKNSEDKTMETREVFNLEIIKILYNFLLNLINSVYANNKFKDTLHSRAYKVTRSLINQL